MYSKRGAKSNYAILLYMLKCEYTLQTTLLQTTFNFQCTYILQLLKKLQILKEYNSQANKGL